MGIIVLVVGLALVVGVSCWKVNSRLAGRMQTLERDMRQMSEALSQMAEAQMKMLQKYTAAIGGLEERIMELSMPSQDARLPLERRHQVLALARQGMAPEEIVKRLGAPIGETETILNLQKYMAAENGRPAPGSGRVRKHA